MSRSHTIFVYANVVAPKLWRTIDATDEAKFDIHVVVLKARVNSAAEFASLNKLTRREYKIVSSKESKVLTPEQLCSLTGSECKPNKDVCVIYPGTRAASVVDEFKKSSPPVIIYENDKDRLASLNGFVSDYYLMKIGVLPGADPSYQSGRSPSRHPDVSATSYELADDSIDESKEEGNCFTRCWATLSSCWANTPKYAPVADGDENRDEHAKKIGIV